MYIVNMMVNPETLFVPLCFCYLTVITIFPPVSGFTFVFASFYTFHKTVETSTKITFHVLRSFNRQGSRHVVISQIINLVSLELILEVMLQFSRFEGGHQALNQLIFILNGEAEIEAKPEPLLAER